MVIGMHCQLNLTNAQPPSCLPFNFTAFLRQ